MFQRTERLARTATDRGKGVQLHTMEQRLVDEGYVQ